MNDDDLLAISELLDKKLKPIYTSMEQIDKKLKPVYTSMEQLHDENLQIRALIENNVIPRLQQIESCYTDTYDRYVVGVEKIDAIAAEVDLLKGVVQKFNNKYRV